MEMKTTYIFYILIAIAVVALIFDKTYIPVPRTSTLVAFLLLIMMAAHYSWEAFKRHGRAAIITTMKPDEGGHSTIHPDDISIAVSPPSGDESRLPNFMVFATGGFVYGGMEWRGNENYFVVPPEHVEHTGAALICRTRVRKVDIDSLPDYIQGELYKLKLFNKKTIMLKQNLWFGMTSTLDGTTTSKLLNAESDFLDQTSTINQLKKLLRDREEATKKTGDQPFVINMQDPYYRDRK